MFEAKRRAVMHAFPASRHVKMAPFIANQMRAGNSIDEAEEILLEFLHLHWGKLETAGVACDEIQVECRNFARRAWNEFLKACASEGAA